MESIPVAVVGAGIIGRTHIETLAKSAGIHLSAVVDPVPAAAEIAESKGVPFFGTVEALIDSGVAKGVIVASPNDTHVAVASRLLEAGLAVLLEKPVATSVADGLGLDAVARTVATPLLIGHHRRHNPIIKAAKKAISEGEIGALVTATVNSTLSKPGSYFDVAWRKQPGQGGPLLINLIHEVDLLRHFFGEVKAVTALTSNAQRHLEVEDTAAAILEFEAGGIATCTISDAACGPWAWDVSAGENIARFPAHDVFAHAYSGTKAGLSLPDLVLWKHPGAPDWTQEMTRHRLPCAQADAYVAQLEHFAALMRGETEPLVSCRDGLANMQVIDAVKASARDGRRVELEAIFS
ncbi:Gfo/Idh/MocA family oxidoreductase [Oricola sp.]|uniref:Gfo/Idh/MocA family protein n=1 Tax=Oricola sp. TaxID=1979950 RepID=UPI002600F9A4|nr:Gfo/Idh/MocA family oxidoreductase [Oricola sp.]MCI5076493.1 Gfo/Idh/MocA family oxidoreductase [Oricola sp.]